MSWCWGAFMSPLFRDPHPTFVRCGGKKCTSDVTCDICKDWSVAQWEAILKKRSYSGPCGLLASHCPSLPLPLLLRKLGALRLLPPLLQKGWVCQGSRRVFPVLALAMSPLPPLTGRWERRGGTRVMASGG